MDEIAAFATRNNTNRCVQIVTWTFTKD